MGLPVVSSQDASAKPSPFGILEAVNDLRARLIGSGMQHPELRLLMRSLDHFEGSSWARNVLRNTQKRKRDEDEPSDSSAAGVRRRVDEFAAELVGDGPDCGEEDEDCDDNDNEEDNDNNDDDDDNDDEDDDEDEDVRLMYMVLQRNSGPSTREDYSDSSPEPEPPSIPSGRNLSTTSSSHSHRFIPPATIFFQRGSDGRPSITLEGWDGNRIAPQPWRFTETEMVSGRSGNRETSVEMEFNLYESSSSSSDDE